MYKVVIADDEMWVRKGLKKMIKWEELGLEQIGEASDGREALEFMEERKPDIIITDVKMPEIDGLELAEEVLREKPETEIIMISGYDEFTYIKKALDLNAVNYILKPINKNELNTALEKAIQRIKAKRELKHARGNIGAVLEKQLADAIQYDSKESITKLQMSFGELAIGYTDFIAVRFEINRLEYDIHLIKPTIQKIADEISGKDYRVLSCLAGNEDLFFLILRRMDENDYAMFLRKFVLALKRENLSDFRMGVGNKETDLFEIAKSCRQAAEALKRRTLTDGGELFYFSDMDYATELKFSAELHKKLVDCFLTGDKGTFVRMMKEIEESFMKDRTLTVQEARRYFLSTTGEILGRLSSMDFCDYDLIEEGYTFCSSEIGRMSFREMQNWLLHFGQTSIDRIHSTMRSDIDAILEKAVDYIDKNCCENINLNNIAKEFHVSPGYFSTSFKLKCNENFIDFLTRRRMEKAKEFLSDSHVKIGSIGRLVGYSDCRYFSRVFKRYTGKMPSEFRKEAVK